MKKYREYKVGYKSYVELFKQEKKIGNIKHGIRQLTYKQYRRVRNEDGLTNKQIMYNAVDPKTGEKVNQAILSPSQKKKVWKDYTKVRDGNLKPGDKAIFDYSWWGATSKDQKGHLLTEGLEYHTNLSGLLHSQYGLHFLITSRIDAGDNKLDVLKDYGY